MTDTCPHTDNNAASAGDAAVLRIRIPVRRDDSDYMLEAMSVLDTPVGSWEDVDSGDVFLEAYGIDPEEMRQTARKMAEIAQSVDGRIHAPEISCMDKCDWAESWKQFYHVIRVSPRITIRPAWEQYSPSGSEEIVVDIEPGMSFGTGIHPTTQSCLKFLDASAAGAGGDMTVIDIGCGSGILSIAAAKLGFKHVYGFDYDPDAVRISSENAALNGVSVQFAVKDITEGGPMPCGDIVIANILSGVLIEAAGAVSGAVAPDGVLILSGILETQYGEVAEAYQRCGFREKSSIVSGEWKSGMFIR